MMYYFLSFLRVWIFAFHPIHVSVTELAYDEKEKQLEITMRVFTDDLEQALRKSAGISDLDIMDGDTAKVDQLMKTYLKDHFSVLLDNRQQSLVYLGHERDGDAMVFYIEGTKVKKWNSLSIKNDLLMDVFEDQSNLINCYLGEEVKSLRLTKDSSSGVISF
jgi:hypothetical protein